MRCGVCFMYCPDNFKKQDLCRGVSAAYLVGRKGFTLVELLVTLVIMVIVGGAAMSVFINSAQSEARQQENYSQIYNLRNAFSTISEDIRMAGSGMTMLGVPRVQVFVDPSIYAGINDPQTPSVSGWFRYPGSKDYGVRAIWGTDSGATPGVADSLVLFRADVENFTFIGRLDRDFTPGDATNGVDLLLSENITEGQEVSNGDILAVVSGNVAVIVEVNGFAPKTATDTLPLGSRFFPKEKMIVPEEFTFPQGTPVYNLSDVVFVTYFLDSAKNRLMANYHDNVADKNAPANSVPHVEVVATNIEDFQVGYYLSPGNNVNGQTVGPPSDAVLDGGTWISGVRLGLVSRSSAKGLSTSKPVDLLGHKANQDTQYSRRLLVENVKLRNFGN